jgi:tether containing UBX domain for GLUT4
MSEPNTSAAAPEQSPSTTTAPAAPDVAAPAPTPASQALPTDYKLYRASNSRTDASAAADLPDDFYAPTSADLKAAQATLHARTEALKNAPLRTQEMRDKAQKERDNRWPSVRLLLRRARGSAKLMYRAVPRRPASACASPTARSSRRRSPRRTKSAPCTPSCAARSARTSSRSSSCSVRLPPRSAAPRATLIATCGADQLPARELKVSDLNVRDLSLLKLELAPASVLQLRFVDDALNRALPLLPSG